VSALSANGAASVQTAEKRLAAIEAKRAARKAMASDAKLEQTVVDMEALDAAEVEHGDGRVARIDLDFYEAGLPTFVLARMPKPIEFKRYQDQCAAKNRSGGNDIVAASLKAGNTLADGCRIYPDDKTYALVLERSPGVHSHLAQAALKLAQGHADEEGKG
jgi:hypothetical protein